VLFPGRGTVVVDKANGSSGHRLGQFPGVADGGRAADEPGPAAVEPADSIDPPDQIGQVAAVDAPVGVEFVDDDVAQVLQELDPLGMVGKDAGVHHIGIADNYLPGLAALLRRLLGVSPS
jgi:hypothetical protein